MEQLEAQERKVRSTKATLSEQSEKVAPLEAEAQEAKRLVAEGTPHGSDVGEGAGENDRAFSVQSEDELAGGLDPDDEMGMPQEYVEDHEPNKRARMVAKPKAAPRPSTALGFGPPDNAQHAMAMLSGFDSNQLSMLVQAVQMVQGGSSHSTGNDVIEEEGQWKLVSRRKNKRIVFPKFSKSKG